jgi:hypothetical protein
MIRVSIIGDNLILVDAIASLLMAKIRPDVLQLTYSQPHQVDEAVHDHGSMVIVIDDGGSDLGSLVPVSFEHDVPVLVIKVSLRSIDMDICESYLLVKPLVIPVTKVVIDFISTYLSKTVINTSALEMRMAYPWPTMVSLSHSPFKT